MRIKEAAELTGTTVRTIRWYHREGLVPIPPVRGGYRDYQIEHVARVLRVRWLAQAGLSLSAVRDLLAQDPADDVDDVPEAPGTQRPADGPALGDLHAALENIDGAIEELHGQRERILQLIDSAESGKGLSSVPAEIGVVYDRLEAAIPDDPHIQRVLRRERRMAEMLTQRGFIKSDVMQKLSMDTRTMDECADFLVRFVAIRDVPAPELEASIQAFVDEVLTWCKAHGDLMSLYLSVVPGWATPAVRSVVMRMVMLEYRDPHQRDVIKRLLEGLNDLVDEGHFAVPPHIDSPLPVTEIGPVEPGSLSNQQAGALK
ncbi:MerR family transcriptional regulator [Kocuria sp. JC486]|nr:MerR family transcriptional regulator [Kocuria sp. JC486]NHU85538.1 MerR family transcriptional regulator [Kocuria sp. JC486]